MLPRARAPIAALPLRAAAVVGQLFNGHNRVVVLRLLRHHLCLLLLRDSALALPRYKTKSKNNATAAHNCHNGQHNTQDERNIVVVVAAAAAGAICYGKSWRSRNARQKRSLIYNSFNCNK